jgi:hypothetical protein
MPQLNDDVMTHGDLDDKVNQICKFLTLKQANEYRAYIRRFTHVEPKLVEECIRLLDQNRVNCVIDQCDMLMRHTHQGKLDHFIEDHCNRE